MPQDALLELAYNQTATASFNGPAVQINGPPYTTAPLWVRVNYNSLFDTTGTPTFQFNVGGSTDGATFTELALGANSILTFGTSPSHGLLYIMLPGAPGSYPKFIRIELVITSGTAPSIVFSADISLTNP
jgi:hypothetical protein